MKDFNIINCKSLTLEELIHIEGGTDGGKGVFRQIGAWMGRLFANIVDADHSTFAHHSAGPGAMV